MPARRLQWAVASGFVGWALARVVAADRCKSTDTPGASMLSFTPQVTAASWLAAALLTDPGAAALAGAAAAVLTASVAPRAIPQPQPSATGPVLRVITANLLVGRASAEPLTALVHQTGADVLFVQELTADAESRLRKAGLADELPFAITDMGTADHRGGGIYARFPLEESPIPTAPWACPVATLRLPSAPVRVVCVHLHAPKPPWERSRVTLWRHELADLASFRAPAGPTGESDDGVPPVILAGDFNSTVDHGEFRRLLRSGFADAALRVGKGLVPTWGSRPGTGPGLLTLDHVLVDPRCAGRGVRVFRLPGSDHRALYAEIALPG